MRMTISQKDSLKMKTIRLLSGSVIIVIWVIALVATYLAEVITYFIMDRLPRLPLPPGDEYYGED